MTLWLVVKTTKDRLGDYPPAHEIRLVAGVTGEDVLRASGAPKDGVVNTNGGCWTIRDDGYENIVWEATPVNGDFIRLDSK